MKDGESESLGLVRLLDGTVAEIVSAFDADGEETDDVENCASLVVYDPPRGYLVMTRDAIMPATSDILN